jgi:hypothetical protein
VQIATGQDEFVSHIERLVRERHAGRQLSPAQLSPLEWEALLIWDEAEEQHRIAHQERIEAMYEMMLALIKAH